MSTLLVPLLQTWSEVKEDFSVNWLIYLSMPFIAAFVGYSTKLVALQMLYRPIEFRGIGPFGWQGVVPRRAGKTANLALPHLTPTYVSHLLSMGLVESGPEDPTMKTDYEILAADTAVLRAIKKASRGPLPARIEKYTLRLSGLGLELWSAANTPRS